MKHDFSTPVDRRDTGSMKWERFKGREAVS